MKGKGTRRKAREAAMQALFEWDQNPSTPLDRSRAFLREELDYPELEAFAWERVEGVRRHCDVLDDLIQQAAENWSLSRMSVVDRSVLRLAVYELRFCPDVPPKVAMNEAVEICKKYSTSESPRFVNGILDRIAALRPVVEAPPPA